MRAMRATPATRPRRRRKHCFAFVPPGSVLEKRIFKLLCTKADGKLRQLLTTTEDPGNYGAPVRVGVSEMQEERDTREEHEEADVSVGRDGGGEECDVDVDVDDMRCVSQELPLVVSQMSEGLEILLRAGQSQEVDG